jgi:hypothetical protein
MRLFFFQGRRTPASSGAPVSVAGKSRRPAVTGWHEKFFGDRNRRPKKTSGALPLPIFVC